MLQQLGTTEISFVSYLSLIYPFSEESNMHCHKGELDEIMDAGNVKVCTTLTKTALYERY